MSKHELNMDYTKYKDGNNDLLNTKIGPYIVEKFIGSGAYGSVYRGIDDNTNKRVAIKVLDLAEIEKDPNGRVREIRRRLSKTESELMMKCDSQNVLKCYQVYENKFLKIMVIEYCNGGTLQTEIMTKKRIPEKQAIAILKQLIIGLSELHKHNIIHRDLKAENILIHNGVYKIADFGFSKLILQDQDIKQTTLGTIITMAPEIMKRNPYGLKADIWSLGVIFYQMLVGKLPFDPMPANTMYEQIRTKKLFNGDQLVEKGTHQLSKQTVQCLKKMLTLRPEDRMSWRDLLGNSLFADQRSEQLTGSLQIQRSIKNAQTNKKLEGDLRNIDEQKNALIQKLQDMSQIGQGNKKEPEFIRLTAKQVEQKIMNIDVSDENAYKWGKKTHWQCLKTELIFKQIFLPIQKGKVLSMDRKSVEFLYLLISRCFFNLSPINEEVSKGNNKIAVNLKQTITDLYEKVYKKFQECSKLLKKKEDQLGSMFIDRVNRMVKNESFHEKQKFLIGIEYSHDYSMKGVAGEKQSLQDFGDFNKKQQVAYTATQYIPDVLKQLNQQKQKYETVIDFLKLYQDINDIEQNDKRGFKQIVKEKLLTKKVEVEFK